MKIIFLDVDGILNSSDTKVTFNGFIFVEEKFVGRLAHLVHKTGAKIVLSSDWRYNHDAHYMALCSVLGRYGLEIFDETPVFKDGSLFCRQKEIKDWLIDHPDVERFIVLEDFWPMPEFENKELILVPNGLENSNVELGIKILNREEN